MSSRRCAVASLSGVSDAASSAGRSSALLWSAVFAPGLVLVGLGVFVFGSSLVIGLGILLLVAPLAVQMFGPDWDRETIPDSHHHDQSPASSDRPSHE